MWWRRFLILFIFASSCQLFKHIGCTTLHNGEQVELIKYLGKGFYKVRPIKDTVTIIVHEQDLE